MQSLLYQPELVAGAIHVDARLHTISPDGRWLLMEMQQQAVLVDLTTGTTKSHTLPVEAVIAHWQ